MTKIKGKFNDEDHAGSAIADGSKYILRLFVSGILINSTRAIKNINHICELYLKGNFNLEIIDIYQQPELAINEQIIVVPVMIIKNPLPERRIIGDLSNVEKVLEVLNLK